MKKILWAESVLDLDAFLEGFNSKKGTTNPYHKETNKWYSWNRGFNSAD